MELRLNQLIYHPGEKISVALDLDDRPLLPDTKPAVLLSAPESGDVEVLILPADSLGGTYLEREAIPIRQSAPDSPATPLDGALTLQPGEIFHAVWDKDEARIPLGVLDAGFAPNDDYREPLIQCDLEGDNLIAGFLNGVECAPGIAVRPPTVGNSFFGTPSWHGNGVVTTAGGIINSGWGSAGVGGQVVEPMLYRYGLGLVCI